jgi:hypothetical protein
MRIAPAFKFFFLGIQPKLCNPPNPTGEFAIHDHEPRIEQQKSAKKQETRPDIVQAHGARPHRKRVDDANNASRHVGHN